jgi:hypothetical protein
MGPRASGKSTGMSIELMRRICKQAAGKDGIRRSRWAVVRNTYPELRDTTVQTWLQWFPEDTFGKINWHDMVHKLRFNDVEADILFRALDRPGDVKKLLSLELTGAWVNEAREIPYGLIRGLMDAIGRFPPLVDGGPTWHGIVMDTNPPDTDHWWYRVAEEERPKGWEFWRQPGGLMEVEGEFIPNPDAENLEHLLGGADWYLSRAQGAPRDHVKVYYCSEYGFVIEGRSVYPEYVDSVHCLPEEVEPMDRVPITIGLDFGLTPAALFCQRNPGNGRWVWFDELVTEEMGIERFSELLIPKLNHYGDFEFRIFGDPAGAIRSQTDEKTCYQILDANGIEAVPAPSNVFTLRREATSAALRRLIDGKPGLLISPRCRVARKALAGGYHFKRVQVSGEDRYHDEPAKNKYSHVAEAGQYAMLGEGEGDFLMKGERPEPLKQWKPRLIYSPEHEWMM